MRIPDTQHAGTDSTVAYLPHLPAYLDRPHQPEEQKMARSRFSEEQIIKILREQEAGETIGEVCRRHGISDATFYKWKAKYRKASGVRSLRALEEENHRLKKLLAESVLDNAVLKELLKKGG